MRRAASARISICLERELCWDGADSPVLGSAGLVITCCPPRRRATPSQPCFPLLSPKRLLQAAEPLAGLDRKTERFLGVNLSGAGLTVNFLQETLQVGAAPRHASRPSATARLPLLLVFALWPSTHVTELIPGRTLAPTRC